MYGAIEAIINAQIRWAIIRRWHCVVRCVLWPVLPHVVISQDNMPGYLRLHIPQFKFSTLAEDCKILSVRMDWDMLCRRHNK